MIYLFLGLTVLRQKRLEVDMEIEIMKIKTLGNNKHL